MSKRRCLRQTLTDLIRAGKRISHIQLLALGIRCGSHRDQKRWARQLVRMIYSTGYRPSMVGDFFVSRQDAEAETQFFLSLPALDSFEVERPSLN